MPLNFPSSPAVNEKYTFAGRTWIWNGSAWDSVNNNGITGTKNQITVSETTGNVVVGLANSPFVPGDLTVTGSNISIVGNRYAPTYITFNTGNTAETALYPAGIKVGLGSLGATAAFYFDPSTNPKRWNYSDGTNTSYLPTSFADFAVKNADNNFSASQTISTAGGILTLIDTDSSQTINIIPSIRDITYQESSGNVQNLQFANLTGLGGLEGPVEYTVTLPATTTTLAGLNVEQTFTQPNAFAGSISTNRIGPYNPPGPSTYMAIGDYANSGNSNLIKIWDDNNEITIQSPSGIINLNAPTVSINNTVTAPSFTDTYSFVQTYRTTTTATTANQTIATVPGAYSGGVVLNPAFEVTVSAWDTVALKGEMLKMLVIQDGTNTVNTQYGLIRTGATGPVSSYSTSLTGVSNKSLLICATPLSANSTVFTTTVRAQSNG